ncbi:beta-hexosaminidase 3 [Olea europaea subsp. europaea]|uniref:beta-N-acetylhexosaminidase n=1 Tax=Olea europaea subsp. europaea TaxID=158383 RepID=A0A8S0V018_OLEEU|nr:beta-hexosaminidase 3 [Olea europaea subsp. europaea]
MSSNVVGGGDSIGADGGGGEKTGKGGECTGGGGEETGGGDEWTGGGGEETGGGGEWTGGGGFGVGAGTGVGFELDGGREEAFGGCGGFGFGLRGDGEGTCGGGRCETTGGGLVVEGDGAFGDCGGFALGLGEGGEEGETFGVSGFGVGLGVRTNGEGVGICLGTDGDGDGLGFGGCGFGVDGLEGGFSCACWELTPHVSKWLQKHHLNSSGAYQYFVLRAQKIALSHGYEIINWEETFNDFGKKLSRKTVVHNWLGSGVAQKVVAAGLRCIVSNQDAWYLDHLDTTWQDFYLNEPLTNITDPKKQALVLGGEVCMWGEHIDASDIEQTIWPRAAAAAERLWTPYDNLPKDPAQVAGRLAHFRCLLNQRGVAAAPLAGPGRAAPEEPGSCHMQ